MRIDTTSTYTYSPYRPTDRELEGLQTVETVEAVERSVLRAVVRPGVWFRQVRDSLRSKLWNGQPDTAPVIMARMAIANCDLKAQLSSVQAANLDLRDSIMGHMAHERDLLQEISSLKRHLNMAIEERDQARKRKKRAG